MKVKYAHFTNFYPVGQGSWEVGIMKTQSKQKTRRVFLNQITKWKLESTMLAGRGGSHLESQHFVRPRWVDHEVKRSRPSWSTWWNPVSTKNTKISWERWHTPLIPATREAEAGESLEPRRQRLQSAKIAPLHSSLGKERETVFLFYFFKLICLISLCIETLS